MIKYWGNEDEKLRLPAVDLKIDERTISISPQDDAWAEAAKLDGCYCLKTDLSPFRNLAVLVSWWFKISLSAMA